jgi:hypothetical protein
MKNMGFLFSHVLNKCFVLRSDLESEMQVCYINSQPSESIHIYYKIILFWVKNLK